MIEFEKITKKNIFFVIFAFFIVFSTILGGIRNYTNIPTGDMWDGCMNWFVGIQGGNYINFWAQHNEHRILLSRVLFFLDLKYLRGDNSFLVAINYLLVSATCFYFFRFYQKSLHERKSKDYDISFILFFTAWLFLWMQAENLTWGFQSQFFLAYLLPLVSLYFASCSTYPERSFKCFWISLTLAFLSLGSMANGLLILPLITFYFFTMKQEAWKVSLLIGTTCLGLFIYLNGYHSPEGHGHLSDVWSNPRGYLFYVLSYLGSPYYHLLGKGAKYLAIAMGFIMVAAVTFKFITIRKTRELNPSQTALCFFLFYVICSAAITGIGRLKFGVDQAFSGRYSTPALMAWVALFILFYKNISWFYATHKKKYIFILVVVIVSIFINQAKAFKKKNFFEQEVATLALTLQVNDPSAIKSLYPIEGVRHVLEVANSASNKNIGIFGRYPYKSLRLNLERKMSVANRLGCNISDVRKKELIDSPVGIRVSGILINQFGSHVSKLLTMVDEDDRVIGYALTEVVDQGSEVRFEGYIPYKEHHKVFIVNDSFFCNNSLDI